MAECVLNTGEKSYSCIDARVHFSSSNPGFRGFVLKQAYSATVLACCEGLSRVVFFYKTCLE